MIDMNKKYKYRNAPEGQEFRRILCIDRNSTYLLCSNQQYPVLSEDIAGMMHPHLENGNAAEIEENSFDLIEVTKYDHIKKGDLVMVWNINPQDAYLKIFNDTEGDSTWCSPRGDSDSEYWQNCEPVQDYADKYLR